LGLRLSEFGSVAGALNIGPEQRHPLYKNGSIGRRGPQGPCDESSNQTSFTPSVGDLHYCAVQVRCQVREWGKKAPRGEVSARGKGALVGGFGAVARPVRTPYSCHTFYQLDKNVETLRPKNDP
jgi:hypothetical protein